MTLRDLIARAMRFTCAGQCDAPLDPKWLADADRFLASLPPEDRVTSTERLLAEAHNRCPPGLTIRVGGNTAFWAGVSKEALCRGATLDEALAGLVGQLKGERAEAGW